MNTYISALGYCHKLMGLSDPSKVFYVSQMLKGYGKVGFCLDSRLPIRLPILNRLVVAASSLEGSVYQIIQFQTMCLRIGEITSVSKQGAPPPLQLYQLTKLLNAADELTAFKVTFGNFKHSYNERPFSIVVSHHPPSCPVELLSKYLALRGTGPGPIFITVDGLPVSRSKFSQHPSRAIQLCGLAPSRYKGHSFHIGAASHAAERGLSDAQIWALGRWKSNAFQRYVRVPSLVA